MAARSKQPAPWRTTHSPARRSFTIDDPMTSPSIKWNSCGSGGQMKDIEGIEAVLDVLRPHWKDIEGDFNRHNEQFLTLLSSEHDTLGRVLKAHLIIENFMNGFLALHLDNDELPTLRLSFHQKAMLLPSKGSSAAFVRPGIL
jgi:hypothetical protein